MQANQRHRRIFGRQGKLAAIIWGVLFSLTAAFGINQQVNYNQAVAEYHVAEERASFWRIVAGEEAPTSSSSTNRFALDLRQRLGRVDPAATQLPDEITTYQVRANTYGGLTENLGFNPFDNQGQGCEECGRLSPEALGNLLLIKQGRLDTVVQSDLQASAVDVKSVGELWMPLVAWSGLVYLGGGLFALALAVRKDCKDWGYSRSELNWRDTGGTAADEYKKWSKRISPAYFLVVLPLQRKRGEDYDEILEKINLLSDERQLRDLLEQVRELPSGEREQAHTEIERLLSMIENQVSDYAGINREFKRDEAEVVRRRVETAIEEISINVRAREEALGELGQMTSPPSEPERRQLGG